jgi:hypothetical protein
MTVEELSRIVASGMEPEPRFVYSLENEVLSVGGWWIYQSHHSQPSWHWQPRLVTEPEVFVRILKMLFAAQWHIEQDKGGTFSVWQWLSSTETTPAGQISQGQFAKSLEETAAEALVKLRGWKK